MAVVRPHRRRPAWLPVAILAAAIVLVAIVVAGWLRFRAPSTASSDVRTAASQIVAELDVLAVSLYTDESVRDGEVLQPAEYEAARNAVTRARTSWERIRDAVSPEERTTIDALFDRLASAIEERAAAAEVQGIVTELQTRLRSLSEGRSPAG
ncbi:hypothetical protein OO015_02300 [Thermomicrobium sp. 4228-Ro]|uniref:hypothetical protein n=1 Tax=Thermomicrobium sp. 4228-Ro TaxID=2993937 RepID=UPI002248C36C|nr:hypothetical protein [Thermomicrobium sp. 4228-Ro]MCX2726323.1 hypothetical protein [Thermomicrobium sp. 4228-Ro]